MGIFCRKGRKSSSDLTSNDTYYAERAINAHLLDELLEGDNEAIENTTSDVGNVSLKQNAAYMVKSPIKAARNVAYENTSEFHEYDYINAQ